jgi:hypothetical protein
LEKIFKEGPAIAFSSTKGLGWLEKVGEFITKIVGYPFNNNKPHEYDNFEKFSNKFFAQIKKKQENETTNQNVSLKKSMQQPKIKRLLEKRNLIFYERAKEDYAQHKNIYILGDAIPSIKRYLESILAGQIEDITMIFIYGLSEKGNKFTISYDYCSPEDILIDSFENNKLILFLEKMKFAILKKKFIPHIIFNVESYSQEKLVKLIINDIFEKENILLYKKKILNPIFVTNFYMNMVGQTEGKKTKINMSKTNHFEIMIVYTCHVQKSDFLPKVLGKVTINRTTV